MLTRRQFTHAALCALAGACFPAALVGCGEAGSAGAAASLPLSATPAELCDSAKLSLFAYDTLVTIEASCDDALLDQIRQRVVQLEDMLSRTKPGSDVYAINHSSGFPVTVSPETADLLTKALAWCEASGGLLDITIGSVSELWDFETGIVPDQHDIDAALSHVDWRTIGVEGNVVTLVDPEAKIDLGAVAKGYIADDLARMLRDAGVESAMINLGGNAYALGRRPDGTPWEVGIQNPAEPRGTSIATVSATDLAIISSGTYERSFEREGVLYHHLLDPRTGMPMQNGLASVSIAASESLTGDALSSIAFLLGETEGIAFVERHGAEALTIDENGIMKETSGWNSLAP